jgi:alpha-1,2-mannosyltransferase
MPARRRRATGSRSSSPGATPYPKKGVDASPSAPAGAASPAPPPAAWDGGDPDYAPSPDTALLLLVLLRVVCGALLPSVGDCDETFNYFEPTHYMLYGTGLQTWEHDPRFALRTYAFDGVAAMVGFLAGGFYGEDKTTVYFRTRIVLSAACGACEAFFYAGVMRRFGRRVALFTLLGLLASAGMANAAPALLPNTFTMCGLLLAWSLWLRDRASFGAVAAAALAVLLGFPFAALAVLPMLADMGLRPTLALVGAVGGGGGAGAAASQMARLAAAGAAAAAGAVALAAAVDRHYYGKWTSFVVNTLRYNTGSGSNIFGVDEPLTLPLGVTFYANRVASLLLNFNALAALAALSPVAVAALFARGSPSAPWALSALGQLWLWVGVFLVSRPHFEERFFYFVYPLVPLAAAFSMAFLADVAAAVCGGGGDGGGGGAPVHPRPTPRLAVATFALAGALSASRVAMLRAYYAPPVNAWSFLGGHLVRASGGALTLNALAYPVRLLHSPPPEAAPPSVTVCVGAEWYRFPSSYFLPEAQPGSSGAGGVQLQFLDSGATDMQARAFKTGPGGGHAENSGFNEENRANPEWWWPPARCDFLVDLEHGGNTPEWQPWFAVAGALGENCGGGAQWRALQLPFETPFLLRAGGVFAGVGEARRAGGLTSALRALLNNLVRQSFYVPWLTEAAQVGSLGRYRVLERCKATRGTH